MKPQSMSDQAASFFQRTRIASPCGSVVPEAGHPLRGHDTSTKTDNGPESAVAVFLELDVPTRREIYAMLGTGIYYPVASAGHDFAALLGETGGAS